MLFFGALRRGKKTPVLPGEENEQKYRRKEIYGELRQDFGEILRKLCAQKDVIIIEAEECIDYIHMLMSIPPHISIAQFMGYLKGKSSLMQGF